LHGWKHDVDAQRGACAGDPRGDLASVGDEEAAERCRLVAASASPRESVNRVRCDTPSAADTSRRQLTRGDPPLDGPRRGTDSSGGGSWTQFLRHDGAIVAGAAPGHPSPAA
jgi:hypothetical protein